MARTKSNGSKSSKDSSATIGFEAKLWLTAEISKQNLRPIRVAPPPEELMAASTGKFAPLYATITANLHQSRILASLRNTLPPKLLNEEMVPASS